LVDCLIKHIYRTLTMDHDQGNVQCLWVILINVQAQIILLVLVQVLWYKHYCLMHTSQQRL